ncbi:MAG: ThuA domain-containing protein [Verrucomicrobiae bacterium]|nr:ThuA domain-containing protein [Verrucomicrobiae bacterium]
MSAALRNFAVVVTGVICCWGRLFHDDAAGSEKQVVIVTGLEYPGHRWQETAPLLKAAIEQDTRLKVTVVETPEFLASSKLAGFDVIVLHYQNHRVQAPEGALANLKRVVEGGKGLVLVHFACGAFVDWKTKTVPREFLEIAGRVWNPKLRAHDPRGTFTVRIADAEHPITRGLSDFVTDDELYTCLDGDVPIHVLAVATSKVDNRVYPMAFVLRPGRGRTFHCALGHDLKAFNAHTKTLYRRGTAWAAGLEN